MSSLINCCVCPKSVHYKKAFLPDGRRVGGSNLELAFGNQIGAGNGLMGALVSGVQGKLPPVCCSINCLNTARGAGSPSGSGPIQQTKVVKVRTGPTKAEIQAQSESDREKRKAERKAELLRVHQEKMSVIQDDVFPENPKDLKDNFLVLHSKSEIGFLWRKRTGEITIALIKKLESYLDHWKLNYKEEEDYSEALVLFEERIETLKKQLKTSLIISGSIYIILAISCIFWEGMIFALLFFALIHGGWAFHLWDGEE